MLKDVGLEPLPNCKRDGGADGMPTFDVPDPEPTKISKSHIKRLRGVSRPQYRLRIDPFPVSSL
jgi:hypothetical protein